MEKKKSVITTVIGVIVIVASIASVFISHTTWTEAVIGIGCGLGLIAAKDANK